MRSGAERFQIAFRYIMGLFCPLFLSLIMVYTAFSFYSYLETQKREQQRETIRQRAQLTLSTALSNLTFADQFTQHGNQLAAEIEKIGPASFSPELLSAGITKHFPDGFIDDNCQTWAFSLADGTPRAIVGKNFERSRLRIMERLMSSLLELNRESEQSIKAINRNEKTVKNLLGPYSAPQILGQQREGKLTPVIFAGKDFFIYWRQYKQANRPFAALLCLIPAQRVNDLTLSLGYLAEKLFRDTQRRFAVAFLPVKELAHKLPLILPRQFDSQPEYRDTLKSLLLRAQKEPASETDSQTDQMRELGKHFFVKDQSSLDVPYDIVVFTKVPNAFTGAKSDIMPIMLVTAGLWLAVFFYYYQRTGRVGLPLAAAFRILLLFSGMMPILLMIALAHGLIEDSFNTSLIELRRENTEKLTRISEKSENLKNLFGYNISEAIKELKLHDLFTSNRRKDAETAYNLMRKRLESIELALDYIYVFVPGGISELIMHDQRRYKSAKTVMNLFAPAVYKINQRYAEFWNLPDVNLSGEQQNFYNILSGFHHSFLEEIFMFTYEKEIAIKFGENTASYFYSVAFSDKGRIQSYVGFVANSELLFRNFLARELNYLNISGSTVFIAAEELANSDFTIFPFKKMNVINSRIGHNAMNFITRCRTSLYEKYYTTSDEMYIYTPFAKRTKYACGCVVSLAEINGQRNLKRLILACVSLLLICLMYVMASFAASHILDPLTKINQTLQAISKGKLESDLEFARTDEIGQLATTINGMLEGFKRRLRLGKYVSTTFERSLDQHSSLEDSQKAKMLYGTVLFSDIRSFTTLSESNPPEAIANMLNHHLEAMSALAQQYGGQVEQFIGDAIVAFFPDENPGDSRSRAISAATAMCTAHQKINETRASKHSFTYAFGIGLEYGKIVAGPLITPTRSEFCIIGAAKAEAERYEQLSKLGHNTRIVVSAEFSNAVEIAGCSSIPLADTGLFELAYEEGRQ